MPALTPGAICAGRVTHQRLRPLRHRLRYRVFYLLLDLDALPECARRLRLLSLDRFNLFSLRAGDHGDGDAAGPRAHVDRQLATAGLPTGGPIRLLTMPRILGYAFNPLSVYFCHRSDGALQAILYEVNSTFGERHSYLVEVDPEQTDPDGRIHQRCDKRMHVSPFLGMDLHYRFRVRPPGLGVGLGDGDALSVSVDAHDTQGALLTAQLDARTRPLTDGGLLRVFLTHPLLTLKVVGAIHWEALRLWIKGARLQPRPAAAQDDVTIITKARHP